jgi:RNA polymerase sigma factor (sigma-70 family)
MARIDANARYPDGPQSGGGPRNIEQDTTLDAGALAAVRAALRRKLLCCNLSEAWIERGSEDLIGQSLAEYARAQSRGDQIANPGGWLVHTAYRRAIDQLRREGHEVYGDGAEVILELTADASASTETEAIGRVQSEEIHSAVATLSSAQRQALSLYFFEELSTRAAADALKVSEPTFRRRRDSALRALRERLGIPEPTSGDALAIEIGLAAWLSLAIGDSPASVGTHVSAALDGLGRGASALLGRGRELAVRLLSSGGGEGIGGVAGGTAGRAAGVCATALVACAASGVIGPGVGGIDLVGGWGHSGATIQQRAIKPAKVIAPQAATTPQAAPARPSPKLRRTTAHAGGEAAVANGNPSAKQRERKASSQFGIESQAGHESATPEPAPEPAPVESAPESNRSSSPTKSANEQFGLPGASP